MKCWVYPRYGDVDVLEQVDRPVPVPGPGQLLVRVAATALNPIDRVLMSGRYRLALPVPRPAVPCFDIAGHVVGRGDGVRAWPDGSPIIARIGGRPGGGAAEFCVVDAALVARWPEGASAAVAAGLPLAGLTALQALRVGGERLEGKRVLVVGAAGGVGHLTVQWARHKGAEVTALASTSARSFVEALGTAHFVAREAGGWGGPYDLIVDSPCQAAIRTIRSALAPGGRYVALTPTPALLLRSKLPGSVVHPLWMDPDGDDLQQLSDAVGEGVLRVDVEQSWPFEQLPAAWHRAAQPGRRGKLVVHIQAAQADAGAQQTR